MAYAIHVTGNTSLAEDAAVLTAFNTLITSLRAASARHVDAGGTVIGGQKRTADEAVDANLHLRHGDIF